MRMSTESVIVFLCGLYAFARHPLGYGDHKPRRGRHSVHALTESWMDWEGATPDWPGLIDDIAEMDDDLTEVFPVIQDGVADAS